jgi:hypothetical protein
MPWKCPSCGFDNAEANEECAGGCGYMTVPSRLHLTSQVTGKLLAISITTTFGKSLLLSFAGDDAIYASEPQFMIRKDTGRGGWFLEHAATAKNPTCVNGTAVGADSRKLDGTQVVSIGPDKMKLEVGFG